MKSIRLRSCIGLISLIALVAACSGSAAPTSAPTSAPMAATAVPAAVTMAATMAATSNVTANATANAAPVTMAGTSAATGTATAPSTAAGTMAGTSVAISQYIATDSGADVSVGLVNATAAPTQSVISGTPDSAPFIPLRITGTAAATAVVLPPAKATAPPTLSELVKQFPGLAPYVNSTKPISDIDLADLYKQLLAVYNKQGATALAVFLKDSGLLEKFNMPASYLDLLMAYDKGGFQAMQKLAKDRGLINSKNEIVAYLTLSSPNALDQVVADMTKLGVVTYPPLNSDGRLQIGIPVDLLNNYQTPESLIKYLSQITHVANVTAVYPPTARQTTGSVNLAYYKGKGPQNVGATAWQKAGYSGKGVRIGVLDMGFGGLKSLMNGKDLPTQIKSNTSLDELDAQQETHGTDCAQIVHGAAPDADMYVAFFDDEASWNAGLAYLIKNNVQIISYSIGSAVGPHDGTFGDAVTIDKLVKKTGVLWVAAAGNEALDHSAFKYNDSLGDGQHHFNGTTDSLPFLAGDTQTHVVMNWNGNWNGGEKDEYDFSILDQNGNEVASAAEPVKGRKNDLPFQAVTFASTPGDQYSMVIRKNHAKADNQIDIFINNGELPKWARVPDHSITTPADANTVLTVGATQLTKDVIEPFSSQGPTADKRVKPDLTAPDNEVLPDVPDGFAGTSGATPLVAGTAALVLQAYPKLTQAEVKAYLMNNVKDLGAKGPDPVYGTGRLQLPNPALINPDQGPDTNPPVASGGADSGTATPPTAAPTSATSIARKTPSGKATAAIKSTNVQFNVVVDGAKNVQVSVSFEIDNFKGKAGMLAIQVYQANGTTPVQPKTSDYLLNNTLGTGIAFTPGYNQSVYNGLQLTLPNAQFTNLPKGNTNLVYIISVFDATDPNNPQLITQSAPVPIAIKRS